MSKNTYVKLSDCDDPYVCPNCTIINQAEEIAKLKKTVETLTSELAGLKNLEQKVANIESRLVTTDSLTAEDQTADSAAASLPSPSSINTSSNQISTIVSSYINEEKETAKRRLNLIIHNVSESTQEDGLARKQEDINKVSSIFQQYLNVSLTITKANRLGKRSEKPRLLKFTVSSESEKASILRNISKLRNENNPDDINNIYITPDLTPKEQAANKALRLQLKELNKNGKTHRIKNGKIVQLKD